MGLLRSIQKVPVIRLKPVPRTRSYSVCKKTDTDSKLEELKISINESTGLEVSFSNIQRNADGEITGISVSAKKDDQKASASYSNSNGIPDIMIGFSDKKGIFIRNR